MPDAHHDPARTGDWVLATRLLARDAGCDRAIAPSLAKLASLQRDTREIVVAGAANAGKSQLLNQLLGRGVLPVSSLPTRTAFAIDSAGAGGEYCVLGDVRHPLDELRAAAGRGGATGPIQVSVTSAWLAAHRARLIESQALDVADDQIIAALAACLGEADAAILVIDALMPVKRVEIAVLEDCARRQVAVLVAIAKLEQLAPDDRDAVLDYVTQQVHACIADAPVVAISGDTGAARLAEALDQLLARSDVATVRERQLCDALLATLAIVASAAQTGLAAQRASDAERGELLRQRQREIEAQAAAWDTFEQRLAARREKIDLQLREHLEAHQQSIEEALLLDLERQSDIAAWWHKQLPYRLQRELRSLGAQLAGSINRQIAADIRWLQDELARRFQLPAAPIAVDASVALVPTTPAQRDLALQDGDRLRVVSRLGTGAALLVGGCLLFSAGWAGPTLGIGVLGGLAAEQLAKRSVARDRETVRRELPATIARATLACVVDASHQLKAGYDEIVAALKQHQTAWLDAQVQALQRGERPRADQPDWPQIAMRADELTRQIATRTATVTDRREAR